MHGFGVLGPRSRGLAIALAVLAKLALIAGVLIVLQLGAGYLGAGIWVLALHGIVLVAIAAFLFRGRPRHLRLVGGGMQRVGDHAGGIVLHGAAAYDLLAGILTFGREGRFRELMLRPAALRPGEAVLDVACGTGTLAIAAKRQVGTEGSVTGIDASPEMIERARIKVERAGLDVGFVHGTAQQLPFRDGQFDIVMGTLMLHHLPKPVRLAFAREARRVLKPGGRLLLIDFAKPARPSRLPRPHRHGHVDMEVIGALLAESGFEISDTGAVGTKNLSYIRAKAGTAQDDPPGRSVDAGAISRIDPNAAHFLSNADPTGLSRCDPFDIPSTSHWTAAAIIATWSRMKNCIVTRLRTSEGPMPSSSAG